MIADEHELILDGHVEDPLAGLGGHRGIGIKFKCPIGMLEGNRGVGDKVPRVDEILPSR